MKIARTIGLAVVAAMALMAFAGAGSASATQTMLCKTSVGSPGCSGETYASGTALQAATSGKLRIDNEILDVVCNSKLEAKTGAQAGDPLPVSISSWSFTNCTASCKAQLIELPTAALNWSSGANGVLDLNPGGLQPLLNVNCTNIMNCTYSFPDIPLQGGNPAQLALSSTVLTPVSGSLCPKNSSTTLEKATWVVNSPASPIYVATVATEVSAHTSLCKVNESSCPVSATYPAGTSLEATASSFTLATASVTFTCAATLAGETLAESAEPLPVSVSSLTFSKCSAKGGPTGCSASAAMGTPGASISWGGGEYPYLLLEGEVTFQCTGSELKCTYSFEEALGHFDYSEGKTALAYNSMPLKHISGICPKYALLSARFEFSSPGVFYVT